MSSPKSTAPNKKQRKVQAAFETRARESLAQFKRKGASQSIEEVFDNLEAKINARREQVLGPLAEARPPPRHRN